MSKITKEQVENILSDDVGNAFDFYSNDRDSMTGTELIDVVTEKLMEDFADELEATGAKQSDIRRLVRKIAREDYLSQ